MKFYLLRLILIFVLIFSQALNVYAADFSRNIHDGNYLCDTEGYLAVITKNGRIEARLRGDSISSQAILRNGRVSVSMLIDDTPLAYRLFMGESLYPTKLSKGKDSWGFYLKNNSDNHFWQGYISNSDFRLEKHKGTIAISFDDEYFGVNKIIKTIIGMTLLCWKK